VTQSDTVVKVVQPPENVGHRRGMWWLPIGAVLAILYFSRK
jgi:hypothetical protein